jgi:hypothetical protein
MNKNIYIHTKGIKIMSKIILFKKAIKYKMKIKMGLYNKIKLIMEDYIMANHIKQHSFKIYLKISLMIKRNK